MVLTGSTVVPRAPMPIVRGMEEPVRAAARGKATEWHRWIEIRLLSDDVVLVFKAEGLSLTLAAGSLRASVEIRSPAFDPLCAGHTLCHGGADYTTSEPAPVELRRFAVEVCRVVALRLHDFGVDRVTVTRPWPRGRPPFASIVVGEPIWPEAAPVRAYPTRPAPRRRSGASRGLLPSGGRSGHDAAPP
jgi:hypothetical protein